MNTEQNLDQLNFISLVLKAGQDPVSRQLSRKQHKAEGSMLKLINAFSYRLPAAAMMSPYHAS